MLCKEDLDPLSVEELQARIEALEGEIERVRGKLDGAVTHRKAADELFNRGDAFSRGWRLVARREVPCG